jgi:hypothetical protein
MTIRFEVGKIYYARGIEDGNGYVIQARTDKTVTVATQDRVTECCELSIHKGAERFSPRPSYPYTNRPRLVVAFEGAAEPYPGLSYGDKELQRQMKTGNIVLVTTHDIKSFLKRAAGEIKSGDFEPQVRAKFEAEILAPLRENLEGLLEDYIGDLQAIEGSRVT